MSLLQIQNDPVHEHDASSEGEDLAKGSSYLVWTTLAAFVVVTVGCVLFWFAIHRPPIAVGDVTQVWAHGVHTINTPIDANGVQSAGEVFDQVLVFANLHLKNQSAEPIILKDLLTNATFDDGIHSSYAATALDFDRIFIAYPDLKSLHGTPLLRDTVIPPGQTLDGEIISSFHVSQAQWAAHKDLNFTIQLKFHPELVLTPKGPITEQ
jgi:hypothetical protein